MKNKYSIQQFINRTGEKDHDAGMFELENERLLEVNLDGSVWTKKGSMVAYKGEIKFIREGILEHGVGRLFKKALSGEGASLTKAKGHGALYLADKGKKVSILDMQSDVIYVNGNDVLAFQESLDWDVSMMKKMSALLSGGLFNIRFEGSGMLAITTHYEPITITVTPDHPVVTDPQATVAWSGTLSPELKTDISAKTLLGRGSGESLQMVFNGHGFVVIQPYEEKTFQRSKQ